MAAESDEGSDADERMTDFESVMWTLDGDPRLSSAFANLTLLDHPPDRAELRRRMASATEAVPRLRRRIVEGGGAFTTPVWRDDPSFDLDHHIRWVDLGGRTLDELVASLSARPFDRERPLWEFVVIEGLPDGRAAMVQRFDHTITDGEGGIRLSVQFLDLERSPTSGLGTPTSGRGPRGAPRVEVTSDADNSVSQEQPSSRAADSLRGITSAPAAMWRSVANVPSRTAELLDTMLDAVGQLAIDGRRSPLWTDRSTERWFGRSALRLDEVKEAAHALGGTVNDLFVTGALAAAATVHQRADLPVAELRVAIPISTRADRSAAGNAFTPAHALLPAAEMPIEERFRAVHERLGRVKQGQGSISIDAAAAAARLMPDAALVGFAARTAGAVDFVCSNVRAAPFDLYIAGALLEGNYPLGPLVNTAFNLTTMSYRGRLFLGLVVDPVAVPDPVGLLAAMEASYRELLAAGGIAPRSVAEDRPSDRSPG
ncbi:MAG: DUF1298 domain-containing protein [Actinobacteria bacterium]|nr:DUF1298 domain-containing protein [Actinomycetota bacterium]